MIQPAAAPAQKRATASCGERLYRTAQRNQDRGERAHDHHGAILAEPVADRPDHELDRAVADGIGR